jgi:amino acid transporter
VLAAVNVGTYQFAVRVWGIPTDSWGAGGEIAAQFVGVAAITCAQALLNHLGIRLTSILTNFSGYLILLVATALTIAMFTYAPTIEPSRLVTFTNFSGTAGGDVWPATGSLGWLLLLGFLLPAYTVTGFDASANTSEETVGAAHHAPRGIVRSVLVSGSFGWIMLAAIVVTIPDPARAAAAGHNAFHESIRQVLEPGRIWPILASGIVVAQFFCGLATVTSASRMAYAFARDGGLPFAEQMRQVSPRFRTPVVAIWTVSLLSVAFVLHTKTYSTITAACTMFIYVSYVIPTTLGLVAFGRTWTQMGPWSLGGAAYRTLAVLSVLGCGLILLIGIQPPNEQNLWTVLSAMALTGLVWIVYEREHFRGPPRGILHHLRAVDSKSVQAVAAEIP